MQLKQLLTDEDAVSPVIGVILMVAITVILAAVIASFVLGLGSTDEPAPTPTIEWSVEGDDVIIDIIGGDAFEAGPMELHGDNLADSTDDGEPLHENNNAVDGDGNSFSADDELSAGDEIVVDVNSGDDWEIQLIWNPADADPEIVVSNEA